MATTATTAGTGRPNRLPLILGLVLGVIAAVLVGVLLMRNDGEEVVQVPATRLAVFAAREVPARTRLTAEMLEVRTVPLDSVDPDAFTTLSQLVNRVTSEDIATNTAIRPTQVSEVAGEGLAFTIQPGMRAVSIAVDEEVAAGFNLAPGDYVDVIGIFFPLDSDQVADEELLKAILSPVATTILANVRVLAVAQNVTENSDPAAAPTEEEKLDEQVVRRRNTTVTLEISPEDAQLLFLASSFGQLRLAVRPFGDSGIEPLEPTPYQAIVDLLGSETTEAD